MSSERTWSSLSFRMGVIAIVLAVTVAVPGMVIETNLVALRKESERAGHASTALREYLELEALGDAAERRVVSGALADPTAQAAALAVIEAQIDRIDRATNREIKIIREERFNPRGRQAMLAGEQAQERDTRRLRASFARVIAGQDDTGADWRSTVRHAIEGEQREVREAQVGAVDALERTQVAFIVTALLLLLGGLAMMAWTRANVLDPLHRLLASTQRVAQRDFAMLLPDRGPREFRLLNRSFNTMAAEIGRAQARLEEANRGLEDEVRQRTAELLAANVSLRGLDEQRRGFIAAAGHELRTPIAVLRSDAEVALRERAPTLESLRASLERIVRSAVALGRLVEDMLRVARADAPVLSYERESVDLRALVADGLAEFRPVVEADGGCIVLNAGDTPLLVRIDPLRIGQVLRIVFDNAVKHSSCEPSIRVTLHAAQEEVRIEIADGGEGIAPDLMPYLLDRTRWPRRRTDDGHGLGLTIAATIMEAHDGHLEIRSDPEEGAVVTLTLPRDEAACDAPQRGNEDHNALADR